MKASNNKTTNCRQHTTPEDKIQTENTMKKISNIIATTVFVQAKRFEIGNNQSNIKSKQSIPRFYSLTSPRFVIVVSFFILLGCVLLAAPHIGSRASGIVFVVPGGAGSQTGADWSNAADLHAALSAATSGQEIWVKTGTYKPAGVNGPRTHSFVLVNGVGVYGGFAGNETLRSQRNSNPETNGTVLSGDLNGDDGPDFANNTENSFHVVIGSGTNSTAVIDGFTFRGGNATGPEPDGGGGGILNTAGSPVITNVVISGNSSFGGGGMANSNNSNPTLTSVTFRGNRALSGGGLFNLFSSPVLTNVTFSMNAADLGGGGLFNDNSSPTLTGVLFSGNTGGGSGGGMLNSQSSSPTLLNVIFSGNLAEGFLSGGRGGGMSNSNNSSPTLTNVIFRGNSADDGGGMHNTNDNNFTSSPRLTNVIFSGNFTPPDGGGTVPRGGGGMDNVSSVTPILTNVTFSGNVAEIGGGMRNGPNCVPIIRNSIFWNNTGGEIRAGVSPAPPTPVVSYSIVKQNSGVFPGTGNLNVNPMFIEEVPPNAPNIGGNLRLQATSPAINAGNNNVTDPSLPAIDLDGNPRISFGTVDMEPSSYHHPLIRLTP